MKKIICTMAAALMVALGAQAMGDVKYYQPRELIQVSDDDVSLTYDQTSAEVIVSAQSDYVLYCNSKWMEATQTGNTITVTATANTEFVPRTARIILTTKKENVSRVITVTQQPEPGHDQYFALPTEGNILPMTSMDLSKATHDDYIKEVYKNRSVDSKTPHIKNNTYETLVGTHAKSAFKVRLNGAMRFVADLGIDDAVLSHDPDTHGNVKYRVLLDGEEAASGLITIRDKEVVKLDINTHGHEVMELILDPNGSNWGDHVDLGNPYFELTADKPELID